ncbi:MAG: DUF2828 family protein [Methanobrevibacter sp.]|nr:DUF2828 family protein [Methanobrevibacter sp.]
MFNLVEKELKKRENISITENGAVGYKSSNSALLDLNYAVSSLRNSDEEEITLLFDNAFYEDKKYALKWLFFARDILEGLGERRLFRICFKRLADLDIKLFLKNLRYIPEYGRWDDLISLIGISEINDENIIDIIKKQLDSDLIGMNNNQPISLLGKWLPSENASSKNTKALAKRIRKLLNMTPRRYRLLLSKLRKYLKVTEVYACANQWGDINYENVPSLANLKYKNAFLKHDEKRRLKYLESVENGSKKINMKVATPVDVVSKYCINWMGVAEYDQTLELAWDNLKDLTLSETLVVADGSGSMMMPVGGNTKAIDVANALAIYTSEHNLGVYKDKYITFSANPQFVDLSRANNLREKLKIAFKHNEIANTNIEAVFDLILGVAVENNIQKEHMIKNILIISDMEFDFAQGYNCQKLTKPLFDEIKERYAQSDYDLPRLIFWNVNSRTKTIPLRENKLGVTLVSGFSQNVLKMVMSNKYDPYDVLIETLDSERYNPIKI